MCWHQIVHAVWLAWPSVRAKKKFFVVSDFVKLWKFRMKFQWYHLNLTHYVSIHWIQRFTKRIWWTSNMQRTMEKRAKYFNIQQISPSSFHFFVHTINVEIKIFHRVGHLLQENFAEWTVCKFKWLRNVVQFGLVLRWFSLSLSLAITFEYFTFFYCILCSNFIAMNK